MLAPMFDFDFDFSKAAIVPEATRVYRIRELGVELDVVGLNPTNPDYWSEVVGGRIARADDTLPAAERAVAAVAARHRLHRNRRARGQQQAGQCRTGGLETRRHHIAPSWALSMAGILARRCSAVVHAA